MHDLGGKQGFGRVKYPSAPHNESWRPLVRALQAFAIETHICNMDEFRHAIERMTPRHGKAFFSVYCEAPLNLKSAALWRVSRLEIQFAERGSSRNNCTSRKRCMRFFSRK